MEQAMKNREKMIAEVDANMRFEGMPLTTDDKERLRNCYGKSQADYKEMRRNLVQKHTVSASQNES
jgi:hypothetical protein